MGGIDETVAVIGEWPNPNPNPNPSPRTLFSSFLSEDFGSKSFSDLLNEKANPEKQKELRGDDVDEEDEGGNGFSGRGLPESGVFGDQKRGNGGGLAARMAARAGFNAPRLNTARIRSGNSILASSPEVRSPYLMIPPGLSPTTLLDSPVFLSNSQGQPSPTTGTFPFPLCGQKNSLEASDTDRDQFFNDIDDSSFAFKPHVESTSHPQQQFHLQTAFPEPFTRKDNTNNTSSNPRVANNITVNAESNPSQTNPSITSEHSPPLEDQQDGEDQKIEFPPAVGAPAEDGYNWRKYGQKQVKGSEYPRSYYKCTNSTCPVKKKVERSHDGHITEIIYKGAHNHPKPPPNRRSAIGFAQFENPENHGVSMNVDGESMWESKHQGTVGGALEWRNNGMETTSTASAIPEFCNPSSMQAQNGNHHESADAQEVSSALSNDDDEDDRATHGSTSLGDDGDGDESESKRRKKDTCILDVGAASRAIREPRVVVQTTSEVDILDDGYRWRKYGQKVVKGNPNPRSYYKCTNAGCTVRKHVERASHDLKSVITTYEGKHNHDVPAARNNSHVNSGPASTAPASAAQTNIHRPEPSQIHDAARFDRFGGTFGLSGRQQMGPTTGFSFTMNQPRLGNMGLGGLGHQNQGRVPVLPMQSYLGQAKLSESGFMIPKGELKEEPGIEPGLPGSNSFVYQMMNRLPLGHQM